MSSWLWIIGVSYANRLHHGGLLRYFNLSRELVSQGHAVTFAVSFEGDKAKSVEWLESLRADGVFTDFCELEIDPSLPRWNRAASLLLPFGLHRFMIRPFIASVTNAISAAVARSAPDTIIISNPSCLFVGYELPQPPCIGDFSDSLTLYRWREFRHAVARREAGKAVASFRDMVHFLFQERYSCRMYAANILVSPVDKRVFDRLGDPRKNVCITNGVRIPPAVNTVKNPDQIVFSGAMNFPPNFDGALWFLDHVFPLVLRQRPGAKIVIAGAMPDPQLTRRAAPNIIVAGFVPDLSRTLAESAVYVAPLVSGSGFKNKIVEAIANGTYVIGTTFAVEFLDPAVRELITVRDDPAAMAQAICDYLSDPASRESQLRQLRQIVADCFSWPAKARELASLGESLRKSVAGIQKNNVV